MKITEHFKREEFDCYDGTPYPAYWVGIFLRPLCDMLEVIRADIKAPLYVSSGYRTESYNRKVGGARHSQHVQGTAADIWTKAMNATVLHDRIRNLYFADQLLHLGGLGWYPTFVHVDIRPYIGHLAVWSGSRGSN